MRFSLSFIAILLLWSSTWKALAQDTCEDIRFILAAAPSEFESIRGEPILGAFPSNIKVYEGTQQISTAGTCSIAHQNAGGLRFSTSYTCASIAPNTERGIAAIKGQLSECLDVQDWEEQWNEGIPLPLVASYGLIRLSVSRHDNGLALGLEVFRDEDGQVVGSSFRGDRQLDDNHRVCTPKTAEQIDKLFSMYAARPGATPFEEREFRGFTNNTSRPPVVFVTRPLHPAHPAIIVRDVFEQDGAVFTSASGDFAGDCIAFHNLLNEVRAMNENAGK